MQIDCGDVHKSSIIEECSDEMMKTTISSDEKEKEGSPLSHAQRIQKLHH